MRSLVARKVCEEWYINTYKMIHANSFQPIIHITEPAFKILLEVNVDEDLTNGQIFLCITFFFYLVLIYHQCQDKNSKLGI